jgi:hypothetical protein
MVGFVDHLYTELVTTGNYRATANLHTLQFTVTPHQCPQSITVSTSCFLATDFNTGTITVSLNHTYSTHKVFPSQPDFQLLCPQAHILAGWRLDTQLTRCYFFAVIFGCRLKSLPQF